MQPAVMGASTAILAFTQEHFLDRRHQPGFIRKRNNTMVQPGDWGYQFYTGVYKKKSRHSTHITNIKFTCPKTLYQPKETSLTQS